MSPPLGEIMINKIIKFYVHIGCDIIVRNVMTESDDSRRTEAWSEGFDTYEAAESFIKNFEPWHSSHKNFKFCIHKFWEME
jgi:hypothetical protein